MIEKIESVSRTQTYPALGLALMALASTSGLIVKGNGRPVLGGSVTFEQADTYGFPMGPLGVASDADTAIRALSFDQMLKLTTQYLAQRGLKPDYVRRTGEDGVLFQFLTPVPRCLDLYPTGEMVVVRREDNKNHVYEVTSGDLGKVADLLTNAGTAA